MAEPLKYMYGPPFFEKLCPVLKDNIPDFHDTRFIHWIFDAQWADLELKQRTRKVTEVIHKFLPQEYTEAVRILMTISRTLRLQNGQGMSYPYIFLPDYVELFGINHFDESMTALEEMTQLISAEFAIRPFILKYPKQTMNQMYRWSKHESAHVRRLSSEGCRPRLPWAMALPQFKKNPDPILPILNNLRSDPSEYVRKSVANNLNDIAKDHPSVVLKIANQWHGVSKETNWILKHGSRTLLKKGHADALNLHGFNPTIKSEVRKLSLPGKKLSIGKSASFDFEIVNKEKHNKLIRLEYAITFLTASGKLSRKVFKIAEKRIEPDHILKIKRTHRFTDFTTRKHFPGKHKLEVIVNGVSKAASDFILIN